MLTEPDGGNTISRLQPNRRGVASLIGAGSRLTGWTPDANTTATFEDVGGFGEGGSGRALCGHVDRPRLQSVSVRAGAPLAAHPGGLIWAHVVRGVVADTFPRDRADG